MKTMKRRALALLAALMLSLSLLPAAALAAVTPPSDDWQDYVDISCDGFGKGFLTWKKAYISISYLEDPEEEYSSVAQIADLTYDLNNDATFYVNITPKPGYEIVLVYGDDDYSNGIWTADFSDDLDWFSQQSKSISLIVTKIQDEDKEHTVTFDWGEGSAVVQAANGAALGEALPAGPVRYSQKVEGWNTRPDGRGIDITADTPITQDLTVYPQWGSASLLSEYHIMDLDRIQAVAADKLGVDAGAVTVKRVQVTDGKNTTTGLLGSSYYNKSAGCWTALNAAGIVRPEDLTGLVVTVKADGREQQVTIPAGEFASMVRYKHFAEIVL